MSSHMTENEREEWVYDLAVDWVNSISKAGQYHLAVDRAISLLENQTDEQLKLLEKRPKKKQKLHGFKKKEKPFGFS